MPDEPANVKIAKTRLGLALEHLLHQLELRRVIRREQHLHRDAAEVVGGGHVPVQPSPEQAVPELQELELVLARDVRRMEHEHVVQVHVGVGDREVGRTGQQCGVAGLRCLAVEVVPQDELLVEDLRVEVAAHLDVGTQERTEDPPVLREIGLVGQPLDTLECFGRCLCGLRLGQQRDSVRTAFQHAAQVVLLQEQRDPDAPPGRGEDRSRDHLGVQLLDRDVEPFASPTDEVDDDGFQVVGRAKLRRPDVGLDLPICEHGHRDTSPLSRGLWPTGRRRTSCRSCEAPPRRAARPRPRSRRAPSRTR